MQTTIQSATSQQVSLLDALAEAHGYKRLGLEFCEQVRAEATEAAQWEFGERACATPRDEYRVIRRWAEQHSLPAGDCVTAYIAFIAGMRAMFAPVQ